MFVVPVKTQCHIRVTGNPHWTEWTTTKECAFDSYRVVDNGGYWLFQRDGWEMRIRPQLVVRDSKTKKWNGLGNSTELQKRREPRGTFNKCILGRNGRGSSRRRSRR